jgi:hypothetical protein
MDNSLIIFAVSVISDKWILKQHLNNYFLYYHLNQRKCKKHSFILPFCDMISLLISIVILLFIIGNVSHLIRSCSLFVISFS